VPSPSATLAAARAACARRRRRPAAALAWLGVLAVVVLLGRALAYAMSGRHPLADSLAGETPPAGAIAAALAVLAAAAALAGTALWLASLGVRERAGLEGVPAPRLRLRRPPARAAALWAFACVAFFLLESMVHLRAGLGWHGLHCLTGPIHQDALPILAAFSILAAALWEIVALALAWARRTVARLAAVPRGARGPAPVALAAPDVPPTPPPVGGRRSRAPPAPPLAMRRAAPVARPTSRGGSRWFTFRDARCASSRSRWRSPSRSPSAPPRSLTRAWVPATP
jgi:hypothetical protein